MYCPVLIGKENLNSLKTRFVIDHSQCLKMKDVEYFNLSTERSQINIHRCNGNWSLEKHRADAYVCNTQINFIFEASYQHGVWDGVCSPTKKAAKVDNQIQNYQESIEKGVVIIRALKRPVNFYPAKVRTYVYLNNCFAELLKGGWTGHLFAWNSGSTKIILCFLQYTFVTKYYNVYWVMQRYLVRV